VLEQRRHVARGAFDRGATPLDEARMLPSQTQRRPRAAEKAPRARTTTTRGASRRATWITDPQALLAALERAERGAEDPSACAVEMRHAPAIDAPIIPEREPEPEPLPALREDERFGHASSAGVVVIIRRRRAA
jgi:hypothetical protein